MSEAATSGNAMAAKVKPMRVRLRGAFDQTEGTVKGELDGLLRVKWDDGLRGIHWRFDLELLS